MSWSVYNVNFGQCVMLWSVRLIVVTVSGLGLGLVWSVCHVVISSSYRGQCVMSVVVNVSCGLRSVCHVSCDQCVVVVGVSCLLR